MVCIIIIWFLIMYIIFTVTSSNSGEVTSVITAPFSSSVKLKVTKQESKISTSITDVLLLSNVTIMNSAPSYG